jgi:hypothetical protein
MNWLYLHLQACRWPACLVRLLPAVYYQRTLVADGQFCKDPIRIVRLAPQTPQQLNLQTTSPWRTKHDTHS